MRLRSAIAADLICVLVFVLVGRRSHREVTDLSGVVTTAWPFVAGSMVGWLAARAWRNPTGMRVGIVVWACTVLIGMGLRMASGRGFAPAFVLVASISLAVLLLAWRGIFGVARAARRSTTNQPAA